MKEDFKIKEINGVKCITIPELEKIDFIRHSFIIKQKDIELETNGRIRESAAKAMGLKDEQVLIINQVHGDAVLIHERTQDRIEGYDAHITDYSSAAIGVVTADCVPIIIADKIKKVIGAVHAGWRGTLKRIAQKTVKSMTDNFGCRPQDMVAGIGPSIGPCCYEVDDEVAGPMKKEFKYAEKYTIYKMKNKWHLDLQSINKEQLVEAGLMEGNINTTELCTACHSDLFYSYRRDGAGTGRMMAVVMIK